MSDAYAPMPMTAHPFYEDQADGIKDLIDRGERYAIEVFAPRRLTASWFAQGANPDLVEDMPDRLTLTIKKCAGPAPFVADARLWQGWYVWRVAVDHLGRHVAGDATLDISPRSVPDL